MQTWTTLTACEIATVSGPRRSHWRWACAESSAEAYGTAAPASLCTCNRQFSDCTKAKSHLVCIWRSFAVVRSVGRFSVVGQEEALIHLLSGLLETPATPALKSQSMPRHVHRDRQSAPNSGSSQNPWARLKRRHYSRTIISYGAALERYVQPSGALADAHTERFCSSASHVFYKCSFYLASLPDSWSRTYIQHGCVLVLQEAWCGPVPCS
jgi:hypothetical protein